ncbi:MAG: ankyrin repeat domain-containing protein [Planctomycetota bacterium]
MTRQPDFLQTDKHVPWCWGIGNDVWAMFAAAMSGDVASLTELLDKEPELIRCQCDYRTPLHFAIRENRVEAARFLLERGAAVPYGLDNSMQVRAEQMALDRGNTEMLELISKHQLENFGICESGETVACAIRDGSLDDALTLIREYGINVAGHRGNKPLHWAVMTRRMELIEACLELGADINAIRPDGARPLDLTNGDYYYRGWRESHPDGEPDHWRVMEFLLDKGADYDLTTACRRGDMNRVKAILVEDPEAAKRMPLYWTWYSGYSLRSAAKAGHLDIVRLLLNHGADPNMPEHGLAPFGGAVYDATQNGHYEVVKLLLEHGANPDQDVESSGCPLSQADEPTTKLLREHGAVYDVFGACYWEQIDDLKIQFERNSNEANNASMFAMAAERSREVCELFLEYQPDLIKRMPATLAESPEQTDWLVSNGMNPNGTNWLGLHRLHYGCSPENLQTWIELKVDLNLIDSEHQSTPLGHAARRGDLQFARALLDAGADPGCAGAEWAKPIEWAKRRGNEEIASMLS